MLPFGGTFDLVQMKGSTLKKAFEHSVHRYGQSTGEFLQVGGKWHILWSMLSSNMGFPGRFSPLPLWLGLLGFSHSQPHLSMTMDSWSH